MDVTAAVRDLHKPAEQTWLTCLGCDVDGWEGEQPQWPCRTAQLVYTRDEIALYEQQFRNNREALREQRAKEPSSPTTSLIPSLWGQQIVAQLTAQPPWAPREQR